MIVHLQPDHIKLVIHCLNCENINLNFGKTHVTEGHQNQQLIFQISALKFSNRKSLKDIQLSAT
jgi:hypothetical protein